MRFTRAIKLTVFVLLCGAVLNPLPVHADRRLPIMPLLRQTARDRLVFNRPSYNYAPAIIHDGPLYHLYWCAGIAGDFILHAEASSLEGPWHGASNPAPSTFDVALQPTKSPNNFDGLHTCDPNVLKVGATYFLYYSGEAAEGALTAIGVAASLDGVHFERLNNGNPIVVAAKTNPTYKESHLSYGAGQPAAVFVAPYVYLSFTDSTGSAVNKGNGAGQFALRSTDPSFATGIEELTASGWRARQSGVHTAEYSFLESFGIDWMFDRRSRTLIAVSDRVPGHVSLFFLDPRTLQTLGTDELPMNWREGPAILAERNKSTAAREDCGSLPVTAFAAEGASNDPWSWHALSYSAAVFSIAPLCNRKD